MPKKKPELVKSKSLRIRLTEDDYNTIKRNQTIYGYGNLTRYITAVAANKLAKKRTHGGSSEGIDNSVLLSEMTGRMNNIVEKYNNVYETVATLTTQLSINEGRRQFLINMAKLDQNTRKLVKIFKEIKEILENE